MTDPVGSPVVYRVEVELPLGDTRTLRSRIESVDHKIRAYAKKTPGVVTPRMYHSAEAPPGTPPKILGKIQKNREGSRAVYVVKISAPEHLLSHSQLSEMLQGVETCRFRALQVKGPRTCEFHALERNPVGPVLDLQCVGLVEVDVTSMDPKALRAQIQSVDHKIRAYAKKTPGVVTPRMYYSAEAPPGTPPKILGRIQQNADGSAVYAVRIYAPGQLDIDKEEMERDLEMAVRGSSPTEGLPPAQELDIEPMEPLCASLKGLSAEEIREGIQEFDENIRQYDPRLILPRMQSGERSLFTVGPPQYLGEIQGGHGGNLTYVVTLYKPRTVDLTIDGLRLFLEGGQRATDGGGATDEDESLNRSD